MSNGVFQPLEPSRVGTFLDVAMTHRLGVVFEMAVLTGLGPAALGALHLDDIDLAAGRLAAHESKTDAGRRTARASSDDVPEEGAHTLHTQRLAHTREAPSDFSGTAL